MLKISFAVAVLLSAGLSTTFGQTLANSSSRSPMLGDQGPRVALLQAPEKARKDAAKSSEDVGDVRDRAMAGGGGR